MEEILQKLKKKMDEKDFLKKLQEYQEVGGFEHQETGKITYNKIVNRKSFALFTDMISDIVPNQFIQDPEVNSKIPSIARVLPDLVDTSDVIIYPHYLILEMTQDIYSEEQNDMDRESMDRLIDFVDEYPIRTPIVGIGIQRSELLGSAHAIAFIVWRISPKKYRFAYYDPLAYRRGKQAFDYTDYAFVKDRFDQNIDFIDLNKYCFKSEKNPGDFHCSQYIINAEYCYLYSLFFLAKWIEYGNKMHRASLAKAIRSTYIVDPSKLTRANTKESMTYRVIMMAFIIMSFMLFFSKLRKKDKKYITNVDKNIKILQEYIDEFPEIYGFKLFE